MSTSTTGSLPRTLPDRIRPGVGALIGVLAVGAALGVGHLVAALLSPASSPFLAVGNAAIALAPAWLVEFAKTTFGTADKPVLLGGTALLLLLVAATAGLAARERSRPGTVVVTVLGLVGFAAVISSPAFAPIDLLAPAAALGTGVAVLRRLHALALPSGVARATESSRRAVLRATSTAVGVGALAAGGLGQVIGGRVTGARETAADLIAGATLTERAPAIPVGAAFPELGTPTFLTANADFYRIDTALRIPSLTASEWSLRIHGMVDREVTLTFADLLARPLLERTITMICVSNEVGDHYTSTSNFIGVDLRQILLEVGVAPGADQLFATSSDGLFTAGTPVEVLMEPDRGALLAVGMNGEALPPEHGFPVRMVVPGLYGFVSATKWVTDLEVTTFAARQAYWLQRGWAERSPIKTESRIDAPRSGARVKDGQVTMAGIAWSQPDGISRVEVRVDDGVWGVAELATEVSGDTWRMWRATLPVAPGRHLAQVRATDTRGITQTAQQQGPVPDGATGYHTIEFSA